MDYRKKLCVCVCVCVYIGLILQRFVLRRFTFTTLVQSDRALPTCGASLSQLKGPFYT